MVKRYRIGTPIATGALEDAMLEKVQIENGTELPQIPGWQVDEANKCIKMTMTDDTVVYGLGESNRGMNKRGWFYISNNVDDSKHTENKNSLYASQNFILVISKAEVFGLYVDTPGKVTFDIGYAKREELVISFEDFDTDLYYVKEDTARETVRSFRKLIGSSYIPPKWAFGYGQSRWGYKNEDDIRKVVDTYKELQVPIDSVYMDIDYMERYKDFTLDEEAFPEFEKFVSEMKDENIHLVPIIDAGVKVEEGYDVYEEGIEKGYFCKKEDGTVLTAAVWPGKAHFPDFLDPEARRWFGDKYNFLLEKGIDGFWNDMNEPAIFYTEDHLKEVFDEIETYKGKNLDIKSFFEFRELTGTIDNNPEDYKRFYHNFNGQKIRHDKVHNLFGYYMSRAAGEAFERLVPDKRILMFSRSSFIGMHRYCGVWTGDNCSWWSHLLMSLQQQPALNMCGFMYSGSDMGGFGSDCTEDLMLRWLEAALFTPLYRNHACEGTRLQELYNFGNIEATRNIVKLRYALIPYIYNEFMKAQENDDMYIMPLSFVYTDDDRAAQVQDQVLVGDSVMIAPVVQQNANGRYVYLPEDMKLIRFRAFDDYDEEILTKGDHYIKAELNEVPIFIRKGHALPLAKPAASVPEIDYETISWLTFEGEPEEIKFK